MPYIAPERRVELDLLVDELNFALRDETGGALNYVLSRLAGAHLLRRDKGDGLGYDERAVVYGHVMAFAREYAHRHLDNYEDAVRGRRHGLANPDVPEYEEVDERAR